MAQRLFFTLALAYLVVGCVSSRPEIEIERYEVTKYYTSMSKDSTQTIVFQNRVQAESLAVKAVKQTLNDPYTARFRFSDFYEGEVTYYRQFSEWKLGDWRSTLTTFEETYTGKILEVYVNARNQYNAYKGEELHFVFPKGNRIYAIPFLAKLKYEGNPILAPHMMNPLLPKKY